MLKRISTRVWASFVGLIVAVATVVTLIQVLTPLLTYYNPRLEQFASELIGRPVHIRSLKAGWYHLQPVVKLVDVKVMSPKGTRTVLHVNQLEIGLNLWQSLRQWSLVPGVVIADGADITIQQDKLGEIHVAGMDDSNSSDPKYLMSWLFTQDTLAFQHVNVRWIDAKGNVIPFKNLQVTLSNPSETEHEFYARTELSQTVNSKFELQAEMEGSTDPNTWNGKVYIKADDVLVNQWLLQQSWQHYSVSNGEIDAEIWGKFKQGELQSGRAKLRLSNSTLHRTDKRFDQMIQDASVNVSWERDGENWTLKGKDLHLRTHGSEWPVSHFELSHQGEGYDLQWQYLKIEDVLPVVLNHPSLPANLNQTLTTMKPEGTIQNLALRWNAQGLDSIQSDFENLSWRKWKTLPGLRHISGQMKYQHNGKGWLTLKSDAAEISYPKWFTKPVSNIAINTSLVLSEQEGGWHISTSDLQLKTPAGALRSNFSVDLPVNESPILNIQSTFHVNDLAAVHQMMPKKIMNPKLVAWLDYAFTQPVDMDGQMKLSGKLDDFPFNHAPGEFRMEINVKNSIFPYFPDYPIANKVNAKVIFAGNTMTTDIISAEVEGTPIRDLKATVTDLDTEKERLTIQGKFAGNAAAAIQYVQHSPLIHDLPGLKNLNAQGPIEIDTQIHIPLFPEEKNTASGKIAFFNTKANLSEWNLDLDKITGTLAFDDSGIQSSALNATLWNEPLKVDLKTLPSTHQLQASLSGQLNTSALQTYLQNPLLKLATGSTPVEGKLWIGLKEQDQNRLQLKTDLKGIALDLLDTYGKTAEESKTLSIDANFEKDGDTHIQLSYQNDLRAALLFKSIQGRPQFTKGDVQLGGEEPQLPKTNLLRIRGTIAKWDSDVWMDYFKKSDSSGLDLRSVAKLNPRLHLTIGSAHIMGQTYQDLKLNVKNQDQIWELDLQQQTIMGLIRVRNNPQKGITAYMQRLYLPESKQGFNWKGLKPQDLPPLNITVQDFRYGNKQLGRTHLVTEKTDDGLQIKELTASTDQFKIETNGVWTKTEKHQETVLQGYITTTDLSKTLANFDVSDGVKSKNGQMTFQLNFPTSPFNIRLAKMNGEVDINLKKGRITNLSSEAEGKIGMGKLFSLLSLQTLPRRISLDFSDLSHSGFSFDELKGHFTLKRGKATTEDAKLDGPVATVHMKGSIDLADKNYQVQLKIAPHVTSSLPVVATIAGGPIAGAVTWVADQVISKEIGNAMAYSYKVEGPWENPKIQELRAAS